MREKERKRVCILRENGVRVYVRIGIPLIIYSRPLTLTTYPQCYNYNNYNVWLDIILCKEAITTTTNTGN